ncbi:hypothetical protein BN2475_140006 [Paraburkholderia ribeironis]|uniref:Uncharacterized protein n=1 Tax=Paraburkholderia ribeironis TaxID=1247936 RepID=A0A1N7RSM2_9BURK|nr:hypothetical protein BN2475_140006 [Paraburkholderia ribeironis]
MIVQAWIFHGKLISEQPSFAVEGIEPVARVQPGVRFPDIFRFEHFRRHLL